MRDDKIRDVQVASSIGSIQCAREQAERCMDAASGELLTGLKEILARLESENERGAITDTLWYSDSETLFDFIGALIENHEAPK